jgi:hypothetical protein
MLLTSDVLHLCSAVEIHSVCGCLKPWSIQAPKHLCDNCIDMNIVEPAGGQMSVA